jgi:hypothetical protein
MGDSKAIYIVQLMRGHVLAYQENGKPSGAAMECRGDRDGEQKWILETGNEPSIVALRCVANDRYLRAETKNYGKLSTGEKQWWKVLPSGDEGDMRHLAPVGSILSTIQSGFSSIATKEEAILSLVVLKEAIRTWNGGRYVDHNVVHPS